MLNTLALFLLAQAPTPATTERPSPARLDPARTHAVLAGVLEWESRRLSGFSKERRRDRALYDTLLAWGLPPENATILLDGEASEAAIVGALQRHALAAGPGATLLFYYAGHGLKEGDGVCLANYDIDMENAVATGLTSGDVADAITGRFGGERVLLFADCCYSGGLGESARVLSEAGIPAAALTSASPWTVSTGNWTFTELLVDVFAGAALNDRDGNGALTLAEAAVEVERAMGYVQRQASGYARFGVDGGLRLAEVNVAVPLSAGRYAVGDYVLSGAGEEVVRVIGRFRELYVVQGQGYLRERPRLAEESELAPCPEPELASTAPPEELPDDVAREKASVGGKYTTLLRKLKVRADFTSYGAFKDWGRWSGTSYAGHTDLPRGHWVYVFPDWYIWESGAEGE